MSTGGWAQQGASLALHSGDSAGGDQGHSTEETRVTAEVEESLNPFIQQRREEWLRLWAPFPAAVLSRPLGAGHSRGPVPRCQPLHLPVSRLHRSCRRLPPHRKLWHRLRGLRNRTLASAETLASSGPRHSCRRSGGLQRQRVPGFNYTLGSETSGIEKGKIAMHFLMGCRCSSCQMNALCADR